MGVVRLRRRYDPALGEMVDVPIDTGPRKPGVHIWDDLPEYDSPVTGKIVRGRVQRRDDLARTHSRPWEGKEQEVKEAARARARQDVKTEQLVDKMARSALSQAPDRIRRALLGK